MQRFTVRLKVTHKELHVASSLIFMHEPHAFTSKTKKFILFRHFYNILFFSLSKESKFILVVNASATSFFMHPKTSVEWFQPKIIDTAWQYKARIELTFLLAEFVVLMRFFWMFLLDTAISGFIWLCYPLSISPWKWLAKERLIYVLPSFWRRLFLCVSFWSDRFWATCAMRGHDRSLWLQPCSMINHFFMVF